MHSSSHFSLESGAKRASNIYKKKMNGEEGRPFRKLGSIGGGTTPDAFPLEVRVTTTIEIISHILSNDGPSTPRHGMTPQQTRGMESVGFNHGYGPKSMNGWL